MTNAELRKICEAGLPLHHESGLRLLDRIQYLENGLRQLIDHLNKEMHGREYEQAQQDDTQREVC